MKFYFFIVCNLIASLSYTADRHDNYPEMVSESLSRHSDLYNFDNDCLSEASVEECLKTMAVRKKRIVETDLIKPLDERIKSILDTHTFSIGENQRINRTTLLSTIRYGAVPLLVWCCEWWYRGEANRNITEMLRNQFFLLCGSLATHAAELRLLPSSHDQQIQELRVQKRNIINALNDDPCREIEGRVIRVLHRYPEMTRKMLAKLLLDLRKKTGGEGSEVLDHIESCLRLPLQFKRLFPDFEGSVAEYKLQRDEFLNNLFNTNPWSNYSEETKESLKNAMREIGDEAEKAHLDTQTQRQILFFYGKPGTGKSFAAQELPKLLGLPSLKIIVRPDEDLNEQLFTGNTMFLAPKLGKLGEALTTMDACGQTYRNPVLIIEDFRIDDNVPPFLLQLFDSDQKKIRTDFFGEGFELDISGLIIIITANTDLGKAENADNDENNEILGAFEELEALRDRLTFIKFDKFKEDIRRILLSEFIEKNSLGEFSTYKHSPDDVIDFLLKDFANFSWREQQRKAKLLFNTERNKWENLI